MKIRSNTIYRACILFLLITVCISCRKDTKKAEAEKIVTEWTGKEIIFPADIHCTYLGRDTVCPDLDTPYKILLYTDSTGCTDCKLKLYKWNAIIEEAETIMPGKVSFHFFFQPKDEKELKFMLRRDNFRQAVYIDSQDKLYRANKLPGNMSYQCFLLNKDNKVLLIGNPTLNPAIWDLYKQTVMEKESMGQEGDIPLLIKDISVSCGCTVPEWDRKPIKPGEKTEIKVKVTPDGTGYFRKTVTVFCNTKRGAIPLSVKSTVKG
ncbi:DUF1573 domain-containing protein [uncultured Proteiniphilum sp.]|uniref:DUF1573 domain-containing protein n=1 Tax=uncultured Proteiniphilum sp. TaxID=497637 RepID=UPI002637116C|nr:DUF1573 domain-containing protein [uncultured Proteiniphilum sp.]